LNRCFRHVVDMIGRRFYDRQDKCGQHFCELLQVAGGLR
jgi:hypothetical protein